jgi:hypothetical protein
MTLLRGTNTGLALSLTLGTLALAAVSTTTASAAPAAPAARAATSAACGGTVQTGPAVTTVSLGYYPNSGFSKAPNTSNVYLQYKDRATNSAVTSQLKAGISPTITVTTKGTQTLAGIVSGDKASVAWIDQYVADLVTDGKAYPKVLIVAALDHEFRVKTRVRAGVAPLITGASADPVTGGKAMGIFAQKLRAATTAAGLTNVKSAYWIAGSDREFEGTVGAAMSSVAKPDWLVTDPYSNGTQSTLTTIAKSDADWFKSCAWYAGQPIALGEFGMAQKWGDAAMAKFYTNCRASLKAAGVTRGAFFNSNNGDYPHIITTGYPAAYAAFTSSL